MDVKELKIKTNKKLIKQFPFLLPRNRWDDKVPEDYDYTYTKLDFMHEGWRNNFGIEMCEKIKKCLKKARYVNKYRITEIKEKWGVLRWYDAGVPKSILDELESIIKYYEDKSKLVCIKCGKPTKYITSEYILFLCEDCFKQELAKSSDAPYYELTWSHIPVRTLYNNNVSKKVVSLLKGDMMATWKRYSKHNKLINEDKIDKLDPEIKEKELW